MRVRRIELLKSLDPNGRGAETDPLLLSAAAKGGHLEVVRLLLEAGADKNADRPDGVTALMLAAYNEHLEVVRLLLDAGADKSFDWPLSSGAVVARGWSYKNLVRRWQMGQLR